MALTVCSALRWWSRECPQHIAVSVDDESLSFGELYDRSEHIGLYLQDLGVKPGDRVSIVAMNSFNYFLLAFGLVRIGAIGAPLNYRSTPAELETAWQDLKPVLVFADNDRLPITQTAIDNGQPVPLHSLDDIAGIKPTHNRQLCFNTEPDMPLFIIGTSGSTGKPKGVIYSHRNVITYGAEFAIMEPRCAHGSSVLSLGPFSSSSGYLLMMQFIAIGVTMYIESRFVPERALKLLTDKGISTFQSAPIFFERICALDDFATADLSSLHYAHVAGARVAETLLQTWRDKGVLLRNAYGSTEAGGGWSARGDIVTREPEKCGRGGIFTEYAILGDNGELAPAGVTGEILINSPCSSPGYWDNPAATQEAFKDGWLYTGDLGVIDENGNLRYLDRIKDIIISGGLNISSAEVEAVIAEFDGVDEVCVIAAQDNDFGETPLAIIYSQQPDLNIQAIIDHCNQHLTNYKVPRYIAFETDPLPRLPSGKIAKPALRKQYQQAHKTLPKVR